MTVYLGTSVEGQASSVNVAKAQLRLHALPRPGCLATLRSITGPLPLTRRKLPAQTVPLREQSSTRHCSIGRATRDARPLENSLPRGTRGPP